jgi:GntR family transcriptional regulator
LISAPAGGTIYCIMIDIQHDSPVPIHEQITTQLRAHIACGALRAGAKLPEYRAYAQELLTNPQAVARAYGDLEWEGVLKKNRSGVMEVTGPAAHLCRLRLQDTARQRLRDAIALGIGAGMGESEIANTVTEALAAAKAQPVAADELRTAIQKPKHESRHRASTGIQDLSRQDRAEPAQPDDPRGGDLRAPRG